VNSKQISIRKQAAAMGLSPAQVCHLRKRGMPADIEAARSWRKANIIPHRKKDAPRLPQMQDDLREVKQRAKGELPNSLDEAERIYAELEAACQTASARAAQLTGSTAPAIDELGRRWSVVAADLLKRKLEVIERLQALRVQSGELVLFVEVRDSFVSFLRDIRQFAEAMPASMAMRCNPADPQHAQTALTDWLNGFFRHLHQNPAKATGRELETRRRMKPSKIEAKHNLTNPAPLRTSAKELRRHRDA
jgi:hypothetical protein